jgi:hypothetical protein
MKPQLTDQAGSIYQDRQVESEMKHDNMNSMKKNGALVGWQNTVATRHTTAQVRGSFV